MSWTADQFSRLWHTIYDQQGPFGLSEGLIQNIVSDVVSFAIFTLIINSLWNKWVERHDEKLRLPDRAGKAQALYNSYRLLMMSCADAMRQAKNTQMIRGPVQITLEPVQKSIEERAANLIAWFGPNYSVYSPEWYERLGALQDIAESVAGMANLLSAACSMIANSEQSATMVLVFAGQDGMIEALRPFVLKAKQFPEAFSTAFEPISDRLSLSPNCVATVLNLEELHAWLLHEVDSKVRFANDAMQSATGAHPGKAKTGTPPL